ncbi:MAG: LruC domain-containing protein [Ichthyobacteriaceae bacterium]|nr:LruC domain-containing protein [Ichthyobacteriaceae bacterium]
MNFLKTLGITALGMLAVTSCKLEKDIEQVLPADSKNAKEELNIPNDFDFSTGRPITLVLGENIITEATKFNIYEYDSSIIESGEEAADDVDGVSKSERVMGKKITSRLLLPKSKGNEFTIVIPTYVNKLYITKQVDGITSAEIVNVGMGKTSHQLFAEKTLAPLSDILYGVNANKQLFTINATTGDLTIVNGSIPGGGSIACAFDQVNRLVYYVVNSAPFALYAYSIDNDTFTYKGDVGSTGPRLEYREQDGMLYYSTLSKIYIVDPSNADIIDTYIVNGLHNNGFGDVAFTETGEMYMCTLSGLYRLDVSGPSSYEAVRINATTLPFKPTSLTFDTDDNLWLAANINGEGRTIIMDKITGGWQFVHQPFNLLINDLTTKLYDKSQIPKDDTDGDGVIDFFDDYPEDPELATDVWGPSEFGVGTLLFEDLWPNQGDYDFNDLVLNYKIQMVLNADDEVVHVIWHYKIKNVGASYKNGFGFELALPPSVITSVSGQILTSGGISLASNGTENGQTNAVIIVMDDNTSVHNSTPSFEVKVNFVSGLTLEKLNIKKINPFIFVNGSRKIEVHLIDNKPTDLASSSLFGTQDDVSVPGSGTYYRNVENMPWALDIQHDIPFLVERKNIMLGYLHFLAWAQSGGASYTDWYTDAPGYRDTAYLIP